MPRSTAAHLIGAVSLVVGLPLVLPPVAWAADACSGFVRLDNGRDLSGWYAARWNGQPTGDLSGWSVVDGAIHLDSSKARSHLFHRKTFSRNVIIRLQFRAGRAADSGLNLHGKQFQVRDYPNAGPKRYASAAKPAGQWNDLELDITNGIARITLNGHVIEKAWPIGNNSKLGLGLQRELGTFDFRNIRIKEKGATRNRLDVQRSVFGKMPDGRPVHLYTLTNSHGVRAKVMTFGATLIAVEVPDRRGQFANVTLYLDSLGEYLKGHPLFGSVVGRYANRISGAKFVLDGVEYRLEANARGNHIHGGRNGFQKRLWRAAPERRPDAAAVKLWLRSPDGDAGYPGNLDVTVTYSLNDENELRIDYTATTDKPTVVNLTNHAYWNLAGAGSGDVLSHRLMLNADHYLPADARKIPTGEIRPVKGTPMDFTRPMPIGSRIDQVPGGYDHCYVLKKRPSKRFSLAARLDDPSSGRTMEVWTTQPGVQVYTANGLSDRFGAGGRRYGPHHAVCLETQHYPDSPNKPQFPSTVLRPGQTYHEWTVHRFGVRR
ncbi:MAG: galactose-1-epimerase [Planctomycetes bacterium]|nr:galactose-1-epimerase [Planctomycetota bacterium]